MKLFLFLLTFYVSLVIYGVNASYAGKDTPCSTDECKKEALLAEKDLTAKVEELLKTIEAKVDPQELEKIIQKAAETNPQVAELLKIIQEYGVLTNIAIDETKTTTLHQE